MPNDGTHKVLIGALSIGATLTAQTASGQPKAAGTDIAFGTVTVLKVRHLLSCLWVITGFKTRDCPRNV